MVSFSAEINNKNEPLFTFAEVVNALEAKGYDHIKAIHQHSDRVYEVCAGKNTADTALFLINADGSVKITLTHIDMISYSWLPRDVRKANDAFVEKVHRMPAFFEVVAVNTAAMSDSSRNTIWNYNKENSDFYVTPKKAN